MRNENILGDIKSKSLKEAKEEINDILKKLESQDVDLESSLKDYQRLVALNRHVDSMFKKKSKDIIYSSKKTKII
jgi:exodeoxyribonuclease VII small subunit